MVHLTIHLTEEVKLGGPVQFRWMYPIERILGRFKSYVRNRARPEGSICEQYIADEYITFCSMYLDGVERRFNRIGRVDDHSMVKHDLGSESQIPLIFPSLGRSVGASRIDTLNSIERQQGHRYILVNSSFLDDYREIYKSELRRSQLRRRKRGNVIDIDRHVHLHFSQWLKQKVEKNSLDGISADIRCLAMGPSSKVLKFSAYNINGFKFRTIENDQDITTQNSGIFVSAETISYASCRDSNPRAGDVSYYGKLTEILELNYYDTFRVVLFKCKWVDTRDTRGYKKNDFGHTMARLVYYVEDPQENGWSIVVHHQPRDLYDMGDSTVADEIPPEIIIEDHAVQSSMILSDNVSNITLVRQLEDFENSQIPCVDMSGTDSQVSHNEDLSAPPPLGPELASGKWRVRVIDGDAKITEEMISGKEVWSMLNRRVIVDFNRRRQPIKDSGGLFGSWLGSLSNDLNILPINYIDWRKVPNYRKEMAWKVIQKKFWFDDPRRRKKYVLSTLGVRCRDLKQRLWKKYRRNTLEESFDARPGLIPEDQWKEFVEIQFTDRAKKLRERNIKSSGSKHKIPHALGKKSLARKSNEMEEKTGIEPNRAELFIASRTRSDGSLVCNEARISVDNLSQVMAQNIQNQALNNESRPNDAFEQVFGPEHPGRVRCVGHGPTPSKYFSNQEPTTANAEIIDMKTRMKGLEDKLDILTNVLFALAGSKNHFQGSAIGGNTKFNTHLHPSSSINSDQESSIPRTEI